MKRALLALALLTTGYVAGSVAPRAQAADSLGGVVSELRGIRQELRDIRRALER